MLPKEWTQPCGSSCTKKYANLVQIPWRIFCKKGCDADGETWDECQDECNDICYKDPVLKDHEWTAYIDRSPGQDNYSLECFRACISGCGFRVIFQKYRISYDDIVYDLCPVLSVQQMYRICTQYWDDKYNSQSVSPSVLADMSKLMVNDSSDGDTEEGAFLLDDDLSIPFTVDEIASSVPDKDLLEVKAPEELLNNAAFQFLLE